MRFSVVLELHDAIGRADSVGNFLQSRQWFALVPHPQPDQPERQQAAQFCTTFNG